MDGLSPAGRARARRAAAALVLGVCLGGLGVSATAANATAAAQSSAEQPYVRVHWQSVAPAWHAYAQIEPIATVELRAVASGTLRALRLLPGSPVRAGDIVALVGGPRMHARLVASAQRLASAGARRQAAARLLAIERRKLAEQLATRQELDAAQSELGAADAAVRTAAARLRDVRSQRIVRAPVAGTILQLMAANGEQIAAGQAIARLQPAGHLWIRAEYYGAQASELRVGMRGRFRPAGAQGRGVPVQIAAISPALAPDGGLRVGLVALAGHSPQGWMNGQWGRLRLEGPSRMMAMVPTRALILDQGQWWVLVRTPKGDRPTRVEPGSARGWQTEIVSGLSPGQQVRVTDAFLDYHRGIASRYTPPD